MRDLLFIKGYLLRDSYHRHKCPVNGREQIVGLHLEFITGSIIAFHVNRGRILAFFFLPCCSTGSSSVNYVTYVIT